MKLPGWEHYEEMGEGLGLRSPSIRKWLVISVETNRGINSSLRLGLHRKSGSLTQLAKDVGYRLPHARKNFR